MLVCFQVAAAQRSYCLRRSNRAYTRG